MMLVQEAVSSAIRRLLVASQKWGYREIEHDQLAACRTISRSARLDEGWSWSWWGKGKQVVDFASQTELLVDAEG